MKGKHIALGIGIGLALTVTSYLIIRAKKKNNDSKKEKSPTDNQEKQEEKQESAYSPEKKQYKANPQKPNPKGKFVRPMADEFPLRLGSKGKKVERLNIWLMRNVGWTGKITDEFTEDTQDKLMKYLKVKQLDKQKYLKLGMNKPIYEQGLAY